MKNIKQLLKYSLFTILSIFAFSCDSDEGEVAFAEGNSFPVLRETDISFFDINEEITFDVFVEPNAELSSLEIYKGEVAIADAVVGEGTVAENTAVFSSATLLPFDFEDSETGTIDLTVFSTGTNGDVGRTFLSLDVVSPLSFTNEVQSVIFGDTTIEEDEDVIISFQTFTIGASIDDITLFWKNGEDGTYVEDTVVSLTPEGGEIDLRNLDYINEYGLDAGDELFYQVVVTSGTLKDSIETSVEIL